MLVGDALLLRENPKLGFREAALRRVIRGSRDAASRSGSRPDIWRIWRALKLMIPNLSILGGNDKDYLPKESSQVRTFVRINLRELRETRAKASRLVLKL